MIDGHAHLNGSNPRAKWNSGNADEPLPLIRSLGVAGPFPYQALGSDIEAAVRGLMDVTQAPGALCAVSALGACALAAQAHADVVLPIGQGQSRPLSLYLVTIARSGERKTTTDREALTAAYEREGELRQEARDQRKLIEAGELESQPPLVPILTCEEPTAEGLMKLLVKGQPSIGVFTAEGGQFVGGHCLRSKLRTASELSSLWDGTPLKRVRAGEQPQVIAGRRVSVHLMMQPGVAQSLIGDPLLSDQGLLARILPSAPESTIGTRLFRDPNSASLLALARFKARLKILLTRPPLLVPGTRNELNPRLLIMEPHARQRWITFSDAIERLQAPGGDFTELTAFASKLAEHASRLAGVMLMFDEPDAKQLDAEHMGRGIELAQWFAGEALRLYGGGAKPHADLMDAEALRRWLLNVWREHAVSIPDIVQRGPNAIRSTDRARKLVTILARHRWVRPLVGGATVNGRMRREAYMILGRASSLG